MSKAHEDRRDAPIRRFLLQALRRAGLTARQWDIVAFLADNSYGWRDLSSHDKRRRKDRTQVTYQEIADDIGTSFNTVSRSLRSLIDLNIVTEYEKPLKNSPGIYGINSNVDQWVSIQNGSAKMGTQKPRPISHLGHQNPGPKLREKPTQVVEKPHNDAGLRPSNIDLNLDIESRCENSGSFGTHISTVAEAVNAAPMDRFTALNHADRNYFRRFGQSLTPAERMDLADFFDLSDHKNSLLAIWLEILPAAFDERQEMRRDPERSRYAKGSPYKATRRMAGDRYAELKALKKSS